MNFDKFKNIDPKACEFDNVDEKYAESLISLTPRKKTKLVPVITTVAAAVVIVFAVTVWALIGRGIRNANTDDPIIASPADSDDKEPSGSKPEQVVENTVVVGFNAVHFPEWQDEILLNSAVYFEFGGSDAGVIRDILDSLEGFDKNALCKCLPEYIVKYDGKSIGLSLGGVDDESYARNDDGQLSLDWKTAEKVADIFERQLVAKNRVYYEAAETELMLTSREGTEISRYVFMDENSDKLLTFALSADYQEGIQPYDAEYKLGMKYSSPARFGLSLKGDTPFIVCEKGVYYLNKNEVDELKKAIVGGAVAQNQIKAEPSYEAPYQARVAVSAYPDDGKKYMFYNDDSDELLLLLESYYYQPTNGACSCQPSVCITPTHLRNEYPRASSYVIAFCEDSTHIYYESGSLHTVVSRADGDRMKEILYKNCKEPYVSDTQNQ